MLFASDVTHLAQELLDLGAQQLGLFGQASRRRHLNGCGPGFRRLKPVFHLWWPDGPFPQSEFGASCLAPGPRFCFWLPLPSLGRKSSLCRLDVGQELVDGRAEFLGLLRQLAGGLQHLG